MMLSYEEAVQEYIAEFERNDNPNAIKSWLKLIQIPDFVDLRLLPFVEAYLNDRRLCLIPVSPSIAVGELRYFAAFALATLKNEPVYLPDVISPFKAGDPKLRAAFEEAGIDWNSREHSLEEKLARLYELGKAPTGRKWFTPQKHTRTETKEIEIPLKSSPRVANLKVSSQFRGYGKHFNGVLVPDEVVIQIKDVLRRQPRVQFPPFVPIIKLIVLTPDEKSSGIHKIVKPVFSWETVQVWAVDPVTTEVHQYTKGSDTPRIYKGNTPIDASSVFFGLYVKISDLLDIPGWPGE